MSLPLRDLGFTLGEDFEDTIEAIADSVKGIDGIKGRHGRYMPAGHVKTVIFQKVRSAPDTDETIGVVKVTTNNGDPEMYFPGVTVGEIKGAIGKLVRNPLPSGVLKL